MAVRLIPPDVYRLFAHTRNCNFAGDLGFHLLILRFNAEIVVRIFARLAFVLFVTQPDRQRIDFKQRLPCFYRKTFFHV